MKKTLLNVLIAGFASAAMAQGPTFNFESWSGTGANETPTGWVNGNVLVNVLMPGNTQSVFKATAPDVYAGTYAMKIVTVDVVTNPSPTLIPDPVGFSAIGAANMVPTPSLKLGYPFTSRPASVGFYYKYAPTGTDTAGMFMWLTKWNGTSSDTIAMGAWQLTSAAGSYMPANVTLIYNPTFANTLPDTCGVIFSATGIGCMTCGNVGSTLFIDDFYFAGWNGIQDGSLNDEGVQVFPNPATSEVSISCYLKEAATVSVIDAAGRTVRTSAMDDSRTGIGLSAQISVTDLASGLYTYVISNKDGQAIKGGKLNVVH